MGWRQNNYNKRSAKKHGWHPSWLAPHLTVFNDELTLYVKAFQSKHDLKADGYVGPVTFRRLLTHRESQEDKTGNFILMNGQQVPINWDVKIDLIKPGAFKKISSARKPTMMVTHWDACTSAKSCKKVLEARNISTHFCIDNDGTIIANYRGIGLADMIDAINNQRKARCSLDLAIHVLEIMEGILTSSKERQMYNLTTQPSQPKFLSEDEIKYLKS